MKTLRLTGSLVILAAMSCQTVRLPQDVQDTVTQLRGYKSAAEQRATWVKIDFAKGRITESQYQEARALYAKVKEAVDAWVGRLRFAIQSGANPEDSRMYRDSVNAAVNASISFEVFADNVVRKRITLYLDSAGRGSYVSAETTLGTGELVSSFTDAGLKIWTEVREAKGQRRTQILAALEELRLLSFEELPPRDT